MRSAKELKRRLERILRLESEPDLLDIVNHRVHHDFADWHRRRPVRGVLLDEAFRCYHCLAHEFQSGRLVDHVRWRIYEERQGRRALATARQLAYHAWTVGVEGYSVSMDGYLEMEGCPHHLTLDLLAMGAVENEARWAWDRGTVTTHRGIGGRLGEQTILLPGATLTEERCGEAVRRWYRSRFEWTRGHWTHREKAEPIFSFDWEWHVLPPPENEEEEASRRAWLSFSNAIRSSSERTHENAE
jgi:hypothetical protein